jgi:TonB family protein
MRANSPSSVFVSLTLHGVVAAIIFMTTVFVAQQDKTPPVIFELVAGLPTAPDELVAPALGNTANKVTVDLPKAPEKPEPIVQEVTKAPEPEVREEVPAKPVPVKPKPDTSIAKELKKREKVSYQQYLKSHPTPKPPAVAPAQSTGKVPRIDTEGIAEGVRGGSTANKRGGGGGKALTREEQSELNTYISFLINALKEAHEPPPGVSDKLEARVTFDITASGAILNPRIAKSSGNREFDESVLEAFRRVKSIGPTPNGKADTWTVTFRMKEE